MKSMPTPGPLTILHWTPEADQKFLNIKDILTNAMALTQPSYSNPFKLDVSVTDDAMAASACLYQSLRGEGHVLGYYCVLLDPSEAKAPPCTRFAAALAKLVDKVDMTVMKHRLIINTDHAVRALIESAAFSITPGRDYKVIGTLTQLHIVYSAEHKNMAEGVQLEIGHNCVKRRQRCQKQDQMSKQHPYQKD